MKKHLKKFTVEIHFKNQMQTRCGCAGAVPILTPWRDDAHGGRRLARLKTKMIRGTIRPSETDRGEAVVEAESIMEIGEVSYDQVMATMARWQGNDDPDLFVTSAEEEMDRMHREISNTMWISTVRNQTNEKVDIEIAFSKSVRIDAPEDAATAKALQFGPIEVVKGHFDSIELSAMAQTLIVKKNVSAQDILWAINPEIDGMQGRVIGMRSQRTDGDRNRVLNTERQTVLDALKAYESAAKAMGHEAMHDTIVVDTEEFYSITSDIRTWASGKADK